MTQPAEDLEGLLEPIRARQHVPVMATVALRGARVIGIGATGHRRAGSRERVTLRDRFYIGSRTKAMTATLVAIVVEEGELAWDATVAQTIPELRRRAHRQLRNATLRKFLTHAASARRVHEHDEIWRRLWAHEGSPIEARRLLAEGVLSRAPAQPPGSAFLYSNAGFVIAGYMAERATGRACETLML